MALWRTVRDGGFNNISGKTAEHEEKRGATDELKSDI